MANQLTPTQPPSPETIAAVKVNSGTKAKVAFYLSAALSALLTAFMVTSSTAGNEIHVLWDHAWCDPSVLEGELLCPAISTKWAMKNITETLIDQWWRAMIAGGLSGTIIGAVVYKTHNKIVNGKG